jgi:predicted CopG family antitoxin
MRTLNISVSDLEYEKFGLKEENLSFSELLDILERELYFTRGKLVNFYYQRIGI